MADILIRGMEMPKTCFMCPFMFARSYCSANLEIEFNDENYSELLGRHKDCPLVPLPEGHRRCIDADKLAEDLQFDVENDQRALDNLNIVGKEREHIQFDKDCKQNCMWYLSNCPTIVPAEGGTDDVQKQ